jgi:hypothetical protein
VRGFDIATIVQATMREKERARLAQGSFRCRRSIVVVSHLGSSTLSCSHA